MACAASISMLSAAAPHQVDLTAEGTLDWLLVDNFHLFEKKAEI